MDDRSGEPIGVACAVWLYHERVGAPHADLVGYQVEATDGEIGTVHRCGRDADASYLVVRTGTWLAGHLVVIPAGTVHHVDHADRRVHLDRSRAQVGSAPGPDQGGGLSARRRDEIGAHYRDTYHTPGAAGAAFPPGAVPPEAVPPGDPCRSG